MAFSFAFNIKTGISVIIHSSDRHYVIRKDDTKKSFELLCSKYEQWIVNAGECKKLNGLKCSPTCTGGYSFQMDGASYKKCKNMAFFYTLEERNFSAIRKIVEAEINHVD